MEVLAQSSPLVPPAVTPRFEVASIKAFKVNLPLTGWGRRGISANL